jgi:hypothetical protein
MDNIGRKKLLLYFIIERAVFQVGGVSDETVTGSALLGPLSDYAANRRPVLSLERALHRNKIATFKEQPPYRK